MTKYSKYNIVYRLQKWMDSVPGQTFLNYAYSWGASIVIAGTLFKLTHLPGANLMLFIGMGTEVLVFFLSAFDRPFDKTTDGMDLKTHYEADDVEAPGQESALIGEEGEGQAEAGQEGEWATAPVGVPQQGGGFGGAVIIGGGGVAASAEGQEGGEGQGGMVAAVGGGMPQGGVFVGGIPVGGGVPVQGGVAAEGGAAAEGVAAAEGGQPASGGVMPQGGMMPQGGLTTAWLTQQQQVSPEMAEATESYVDELKKLTEMLGKVNEQSVRLTRDSEEMENLNRTLTGISKVYEMQLKSASQQIGTIDQINEQSKKMAQQIEQLNQIYARMIEAMTVNMRGTAPLQNQGTGL